MDFQKGFSLLTLLAVILLLIAALTIPLPRYQNGGCLEIDIDSPRCHPAGWKLGPSLWRQIFEGQKTVSHIVPPSPIPITPVDTADSDFIGADLKSYCSYKTSIGEVKNVKDCGDFIVLELGCCDIPDIILDKSGNKLTSCGGLKGYSEACQKFLPQTQCSVTTCNDR